MQEHAAAYHDEKEKFVDSLNRSYKETNNRVSNRSSVAIDRELFQNQRDDEQRYQ